MRRERYFDNAATTPVDPRVFAAMRPWMEDEWANASSIHAAGLKAREAVEDARFAVMELIGAEDPAQIIFTSGATEGANTVIAAQPTGWISPFEHSAVREPALARGWTLGQHVDGIPTRHKGFGAVMAINNEIGDFYVHEVGLVDATQALGKIPYTVGATEFVVGSAHKLYGPKGIGFLYSREGIFPPYIRGGEQERGLRAGTSNVAGIVGMGAAARLAWSELAPGHSATMHSAILQRFLKDLEAERVFVNGVGIADILSLSFPGLQGETIVLELDRAGFAIGAGAACSSRSTEPSHVLTALGFDEARIRGTIRISFGRFNTLEAAHELADELARTVKKLREI